MDEENTETLGLRVLAGFLVIEDRGEAGYAGGYLCTDRSGVPVEFRYTVPVKPTRNQELLYGRTLRPQLFGKNIAGELLKGLENTPAVVFTDEEAVFSGWHEDAPPVVLIASSTEGNPKSDETTWETPDGPVAVRLHEQHSREITRLREELRGFDLNEPLVRARKVLSALLAHPQETRETI